MMKQVLFSALFATTVAFGAQSTDVTIRAIDLPNDQGTLFIQITSGDIQRFAALPIDSYDMTTVIADVPDGKVQIAAFQDLNGNNNLDINEMGIPSEPCLQMATDVSPKNNIIDITLQEYN